MKLNGPVQFNLSIASRALLHVRARAPYCYDSEIIGDYSGFKFDFEWDSKGGIFS